MLGLRMKNKHYMEKDQVFFLYHIFPKFFNFWVIFQKRTSVRHLRMGSKKS